MKPERPLEIRRTTYRDGIPLVSMLDRLAAEARRTRSRYTGSLCDLARYVRRASSPEAVTAMKAEVAGLEAELNAVRAILANTENPTDTTGDAA